jgi:formate hydrogenlyase subunit 3/multisubunit Na+/H+ antiporter MnhD subunit
MPDTAGSTTVASLSIAGVPPFNGFTSKWLVIAGKI